jgi:hypothetical protein
LPSRSFLLSLRPTSRHIAKAHGTAGYTASPVERLHFIRPLRVVSIGRAVAAVPKLGADAPVGIGAKNTEVRIEPVEPVGVLVNRILVARRSENQQHHFAAGREPAAGEMERAASTQTALTTVAVDLELRPIEVRNGHCWGLSNRVGRLRSGSADDCVWALWLTRATSAA